MNETPTETQAETTAASTNSVTLKYPVKVGGADYAALTLRRRLKVKDLLRIDKQAATAGGQEVLQFAHICSIAPDVIEELDSVDYKALQDKAKAFLS